MWREIWVRPLDCREMRFRNGVRGLPPRVYNRSRGVALCSPPRRKGFERMTISNAARHLAAIWGCFLAVSWFAPGAVAQPPAGTEAVFDASARTGSGMRPVRFRFLCTPNQGPSLTGVLAVTLEIPRHARLSAVFDFDKFDGPDATAGALSHLQANGVRTKAGNRFVASGSIPDGGPNASFVFDVSASRRDPASLVRLAAVLRPLLDGPGQFVWRQGNARPGGVSIDASLDLPQERAERLKAVLGPCLAR